MRRSKFFLGGEDVKSLKACQAMESNVRYCVPHSLWSELVSFMVNGGYSSLPVIDSHRKIVGIVTESNLLKIFVDGRDKTKVKAEDIMSTNPKTLNENTPFLEVVKVLDENHLIRVPVVNDDNQFIGMLTRRDILYCYTQAEHEGIKSV